MPVGPNFLDPIFRENLLTVVWARNGNVPSSRSALMAWRRTLPPMMSQAFQAWLMIRMIEGRCGRPSLFRNCVLIRNSRSAIRIALRASAMQTPARAAIWGHLKVCSLNRVILDEA